MSEKRPPPLPGNGLRPGRLLVVLGLAAGTAFVLLWLADGRALPMRCLLNEFTGLHCPGCGMTRATRAALAGHWLEAFRFNPLGVILLPLALGAVGLELAGWVRDRPLPWRLKLGARGSVALAVAVMAFGVLRNVPVWPFDLLAPP